MSRDPSNSPPHEWLGRDLYGTAGDGGSPLPKVMGLTSCQCVPAPAITVERSRWVALGFGWSGDCGDLNHKYGGHIPACRLPSTDYTMKGALNKPRITVTPCRGLPVRQPSGREYLKKILAAIREDRIQGVMEVIGSLDGKTARYWSDAGTWSEAGEPYYGSGHVDWFHHTVYRSTSNADHKIISTVLEDDMTPDQARQLQELYNAYKFDDRGGEFFMNRRTGTIEARTKVMEEFMNWARPKLDILTTLNGDVDVPKLAAALKDALSKELLDDLAERLKG